MLNAPSNPVPDAAAVQSFVKRNIETTGYPIQVVSVELVRSEEKPMPSPPTATTRCLLRTPESAPGPAPRSRWHPGARQKHSHAGAPGSPQDEAGTKVTWAPSGQAHARLRIHIEVERTIGGVCAVIVRLGSGGRTMKGCVRASKRAISRR